MSTSLRVLSVVANDQAAEPLIAELRTGGFEPLWTPVRTAAALQDALPTNHWDIIIIDHETPGCNALSALPVVHASGHDIPGIVVSSTVDQTTATEIMQAGAQEYVMKDQLHRLVPAVQRELRKVAERQAHRQVEKLLQIQRNVGLLLAASSDLPDMMGQTLDALRELERVSLGAIYLVNPQTQAMEIAAHRGLPAEPAASALLRCYEAQTPLAKLVLAGEFAYNLDPAPLIKNGAPRDDIHALAVLPVQHEGQILAGMVLACRAHGSFPDQTRCILETVAAQMGGVIARVRAVDDLRHSEERFRHMAESIQDGLAIIENNQVVFVNNRACEIFGRTRAELLATNPLNLAAPDERARLAKTELQNGTDGEIEYWVVRPDDTRRFIQNRYSVSKHNNEVVSRFVIATDITERHQATQALHQRQRVLESLVETARDLSGLLDLNDLLKLITQRVIALFHAKDCSIFRLEENAVTLRPILSIGDYAEQIMHGTFKVGEGIIGHSVAQNKPLLVNHAPKDPRMVKLKDLPHDRVHLMAVPLAFRGQITGAMMISRHGDDVFHETELRMFEGLAQQAAIALKNAELFRELEAYKQHLEYAVDLRTAQLRQAKERVEVILENSPDAILLLGRDGTIEATNPAFTAFLGYQPNDVLHRRPAQLIAPDHIETFHQMLNTGLNRGEANRHSLMVRHQDGSLRDADVALAPVKEGMITTGLVCSIHDISALKAVERMQEEFVSNVTHELRTPITSIRLYHDLVTKRPERQGVYLDRILRETDRLEHIIDDLLHLSRIDRGQATPNIAPVDLNTLATQYVTDRAPLAASRKITLSLAETAELPPVQADPSLLGQALSILLTNAITYTPSGGTITVSTYHDQARNNTNAGIKVQDTGPGIAPDEQQCIFKRFYRGSAAHETGAAGTGLGLSILKEIITCHHGEIEVISEGVPGKGTAFVLWLPTT